MKKIFGWLESLFGSAVDNGKQEPSSQKKSFSNDLAKESEIWKSQGNVHLGSNKLDEAVACYRKAIQISPKYAEAYNNLGIVLKQQGKLIEAELNLRHAIGLNSLLANAYYNLVLVLLDQGETVEAKKIIDDGIAIDPGYADFYFLKGNLSTFSSDLDEAISSFQKSLSLEPGNAVAHGNLGLALMNQGRLDEAIVSYRRALELQPDFSAAHDNLLFCLNYHADFSAAEIFTFYQQWNEQQAARYSQEISSFNNSRCVGRRLRIAYLSPDFRQHSVAFFVAPLIEQHDKSKFEVFCYYNQTQHDEVTDRIKLAADHWIPCALMSDEQLVRRIRDDGIDILIDLAGHTSDNRLMVFARKPAPVQVTWMGYGYTTGLTSMDYFIGDPVFTPVGAEAFFSENIYRLPYCTVCYQPPVAAPAPSESPVQRHGYVTFACLSRGERINDKVINAWAEILRRLPGSRLRLDSRSFKDVRQSQRIKEQFACLGVGAECVDAGFTSPVWDVYQEVDIVLDCFPHNSGTTTCEALWMGIPVITLADRPSVGRLGASYLSAVSRTEWIASNVDAYIELAVSVAKDVSGLVRERAGLRQAMQISPLLDHSGFVCDMEKAYQVMWQRWCVDGDPSQSELKQSKVSM